MFVKYFLLSASHLLCTFLLLKAVGCILPNLTICYHSGLLGILFSAIIAYCTFGYSKKRFLTGKILPDKKAILITGCDSGFGHILAKRLDANGFHVFASCLFPSGSGATALKENCSQRLKILEMDVTKDESVEKGFQFVESNLDSCDMWAIVNNAGIHAGWSIELSTIQDFEKSFEVNSIGPVRVTKAFLPLLKKSKGRVVTVTSAAGRNIIPNLTAYIMSKHAAVAFSDCLRQELLFTGIQVISIEPELFRTPLTDPTSAREKMDQLLDNFNTKLNVDEKYRKMCHKKTDIFLKFASPKIDLVINDLESAIISKYPSTIYRPRINFFSRLIFWLYELMPVDVRDLIAKVMVFIVERVM